jgi:hypothetical protein
MQNIFFKSSRGDSKMTIGFLHLTLLCAAGLALQRSARAESFQIQVPFAFMAADKILPGGRYNMETASNGLLEIRGGPGVAAMVLTIPGDGMGRIQHPSAVFEANSSGAYLSHVNLAAGVKLVLVPLRRATPPVSLPGPVMRATR